MNIVLPNPIFKFVFQWNGNIEIMNESDRVVASLTQRFSYMVLMLAQPILFI